ncbi:glycosyltransferase [Endothiovibrio diazotrophicus]
MTPTPSAPPSAPLVTLILTTYNHERYIAEAVRSALAQTYSPLEIIISDDCSPDRTYDIAREIVEAYRGPHQVRLLRNERNLGLIAHSNRVFSLSRGELILGGSGDDVSRPLRTQRMVELYLRAGRRPLLIHGDVQCIDREGRLLGVNRPPTERRSMSLREIALAEGIYIGASAAFSRSLLERFETIREPHVWEDLVWGFRAALVDGLVYDPEPLVLYRVDIGISAQMAYQRSLAEMLAANRKRRLIQFHVLRQRLTDARWVDADAAVRQALEKRVEVEGIRLALMADPLAALAENALRHPFRLLSAFALEGRAWARSVARNLLARVRSTGI